MSITLRRSLPDVQARQPTELNRLPRHRKGAGDDRLAGDDGGDRRQHDERREQRAGAKPVKNIAVGRSAGKDDRGLAGVIEDEAGKHDGMPGEPYRLGAEMAHVCVERFGAGDAEENAAKDEKALEAAICQIVHAVKRIDGSENLRVLRQTIKAERRHCGKPYEHDRPEGTSDMRRA